MGAMATMDVRRAVRLSTNSVSTDPPVDRAHVI